LLGAGHADLAEHVFGIDLRDIERRHVVAGPTVDGLFEDQRLFLCERLGRLPSGARS